MAKTMTTSMTEGQIGRALEIFGAKLRKNARDFPSDIVQQIFGRAEFGEELVSVFLRHVKALGGIITRRIKVNGDCTPRELIDATVGRKQYVNLDVVNAIPKSESGEREVVYFKPRLEVYDNYLSPEILAKEYEYFGVIPDPYAIVTDNEADPDFANQTRNAVQWRGEDGKLYYAAFGRFTGERHVSVGRDDEGWTLGWIFGGVRKLSK